MLPIFLAPVCGGVKSAMKQPARSQDPLSMNGLGRALWNFLVLPTKKKTSHPHFFGSCAYSWVAHSIAWHMTWKAFVSSLSLWTIKSSIPVSIKTTQAPQKSNMACRNILSSDGDFPVSPDVKPQFMYIGFSWEFPSNGKLKQPTIQGNIIPRWPWHLLLPLTNLSRSSGNSWPSANLRVWTLNMALSWKTICLLKIVIFHSYVTLADRRVWIS